MFRKIKSLLILFKTILSFNKRNARHEFITIQKSLDDDIGAINGSYLIPLICESALKASQIELSYSYKFDSFNYNTFPGEHYRFIAGLVKELNPKQIVEIGTYTGMSARVFVDYSPQETLVDTFDIVPYENFDSHLKKSDFERKLNQILCDLSEKTNFEKYEDLFKRSDLIFLDGPKDGKFEYKFLKNLESLKFIKKKRYLVIDDIKFLKMINLWRSILSPKFDATSFAHFSGTGIVDISNGIEIDKTIFKN